MASFARTLSKLGKADEGYLVPIIHKEKLSALTKLAKETANLLRELNPTAGEKFPSITYDELVGENSMFCYLVEKEWSTPTPSDNIEGDKEVFYLIDNEAPDHKNDFMVKGTKDDIKNYLFNGVGDFGLKIVNEYGWGSIIMGLKN